jgi:hypothetical protein
VIGEVVDYVDSPVDVNDVCTIGSGGRSIGLRLKVEFDRKNGIATSLA